MLKKILLRDVKEAERKYANALFQWGEKNQITLRAMVVWHDLEKAYKEQKNSKN